MTTTTCTQPGCTGTILDGYCDVCWSPAGAAPPAVAGVSSAGVDSTPSTVSRASSRLASAPLGSARTAGATKVTRRTGTSSVRLRTARLGAGLTTVPPQPAIDAATALMVDPQVPEDKRVCPSCGAAVGRSRQGQPGRTEGFCPQCRNPFSFTPKLTPGTLVAGQYDVAGALAHGGSAESTWPATATCPTAGWC